MKIVVEKSNLEKEGLFKKMKQKNVGFVFDLDGMECYTCTCGKEGNKHFRLPKGAFKEEEELHDYLVEHLSTENKEEAEAIIRENIGDGSVLENYDGGYFCINCGTPVIYECSIGASQEDIPSHINFEVLQDDENLCLVGISVDIIRIYRLEITCETEDIDVYLLYDKIKKRFSVISSFSYYVSSHAQKWIEGPVSYTQDGILDADGDNVASYCSNYDFSSSSADLDAAYNLNHAMVKASGYYELADFFAKMAGVEINIKKEFSLFEVVLRIFQAVNLGYYHDLRYKKTLWDWQNMSSFTTFTKCSQVYLDLINAGVDMEAKTYEEAFHVPYESLSNVQTLEEYRELLFVQNKLKELDLSEPIMIHLNKLGENDREKRINLAKLFQIAEQYNCSVETAIRHIVYAKGAAPGSAIYTTLAFYDDYGDDVHKYIDINVPFNVSLKAKLAMLKKEMATNEQFNAVVKKPTLDNFIKVFGV